MFVNMTETRRFFESLSRDASRDERQSYRDKIRFLLERKYHCPTLPSFRAQQPVGAADYFEAVSGLASICSPTALGLAMHLYTVWGLSLLMDETQQRLYLEAVAGEDMLFGSLNEPGLYFVHPKQLKDEHCPITAERCAQGYLVSGVKKFVSLEPYVRYLPVYAKLNNYTGSHHGIVVLLIDKQAPGVTPNRDWQTVSMSSTQSNSVRFDQVLVPDSALICAEDRALRDTELLGYLFRLSIASVYYGIADQAVNYIVQRCKTKRVPHSAKPLAFFPGTQFTLAEMIVSLETARSQIEKFCCVLDRLMATPDPSLQQQREVKRVSLVTKDYVVKSAELIVHKAMKIEGVESIAEANVLSSLFREVKAGAFHPPQTDVAYELLAKDALGIISFRNRW